MPLSEEAVQALLAGANKRGSNKTPQGKESEPVSRPLQLGHLRYVDKSAPCMGGKSGRCASPTMIRVDGVPKCSTHALYELNYLLNKLMFARGESQVNPDDCTCDGIRSKFSVHVEECALYELIKAERANPIVDTNIETMELL